jgi:phosphopantetheinyl transferase (holo-ACP synthase)
MTTAIPNSCCTARRPPFARSKGAGRFEISLTHTDTLAQAVVAALPE